MLEGIKRLFRLSDPGKKLCEACAIRQQQIEAQTNQIAFLQDWISQIQGRRAQAEQHKPIATTPQPWANMKKKLEEKYSKNREKPEDQVKAHWVEKIAEMEQAALKE